jgi:hypothetical protein
MQVIFEVPDGATPFLQFWDAGNPSAAQAAPRSRGRVSSDGRKVQVAIFLASSRAPTTPSASAQALGLSAISQVGSAGP